MNYPIHQLEQAVLDARSRVTAWVSEEPSLTLQGPAAECDLNRMVKSFGVGGMPVPPEVMDPRYYGDFSDVPDLQTALDRLREAQERFSALPAHLRAEFNNSPAELWAFLQDPANGEEAVELGLLKRMAEPSQPGGTTPSPGGEPPIKTS